MKMGVIFSFLTLGALLFLSAPLSWAGEVVVVPSDRVETILNVRELPHVKSSIIGKLLPQQSADYLDSEPYWFHVRLDNGEEGYVSKTWSEKIAQALENDGTIRIGSWNIKKLGHGTHTNYSVVASIIQGNFDLMTIIEVMQKGGTHPGYDELLSVLGSGWRGIVTDSPRPNTGSGNSEYYAIIYKPNLVHPCAGWDHLVFYDDNDGSGNDTGDNVFSREPAFGCFEASQKDGSVGFDFLMAGYHARWEHGDKNKIKAEVAQLVDVFQAMKEARPGERDLIIAGDFNLVTSDLKETLTFVQGTVANGSTLNSSGAVTKNVYDHILIYDSKASQEMSVPPKIIEATHYVHDGKEFYTNISDHLPVVSLFRTAGPDDD